MVIKIHVVRTVMCKGGLAKFLRGANQEKRLRRMRTGISNQKSMGAFDSFESILELGGSFKGSFMGQSARFGSAVSGSFKGKSGGFGGVLSGSFKGKSGSFKGKSGGFEGQSGSFKGQRAARTEPGSGRGSKVTLPPLETGETKKVSFGVEPPALR